MSLVTTSSSAKRGVRPSVYLILIDIPIQFFLSFQLFQLGTLYSMISIVCLSAGESCHHHHHYRQRVRMGAKTVGSLDRMYHTYMSESA